jgi:hypothetical protein
LQPPRNRREPRRLRHPGDTAKTWAAHPRIQELWRTIMAELRCRMLLLGPRRKHMHKAGGQNVARRERSKLTPYGRTCSDKTKIFTFTMPWLESQTLIRARGSWPKCHAYNIHHPGLLKLGIPAQLSATGQRIGGNLRRLLVCIGRQPVCSRAQGAAKHAYPGSQGAGMYTFTMHIAGAQNYQVLN